MNKGGNFIISLDFELLWGVFDKVSIDEKIIYFRNTRKLIPEILAIFKQYEIHATWAIVGMLFNTDWKEWQINTPNVLPNYSNDSLSAYKFGNKISIKGFEELCFAKELILKIKDQPNQEIATHTYSHYYCLEEGQTINSFKADLEQCIKLAKSLNIELKSLVFPRNQFNKEYLKICSEMGIQNVRANPSNWYWKEVDKSSFRNKLYRTGDAYFGLNDKSYNIEKKDREEDTPLSQKASRLLRPYSKYKILNSLKLSRIKREMKKAAINGEIYHLWWHPHNFGNNPEKNLMELIEILEYYKYCQMKYDFKSSTMTEINELYGS
ncbi:polysaccharide deacetylase family protein [Gillisia sp. M10.2A]|uniref:Polysaccharide deacetylase family protein n=1 Tax=Gillisia lutea TaxID=2909668 RepID=A0ABS9EIH9_9FLAO|nr:polysaccharide deacetylase family protein [Gillisia lutea]MCF4102665.1 polysaccharide deacetylase family protein [Gillisia lutea]